MTARGYDPEFVESCFNQIRGFGEYGFPESHAASFANLVYVSCWMKCYYPDVFAAALLNSQPMGFYAPAQIVRDAREHGVEVRPVDVNLSDWDCTLERRPAPRGVLQMRHASMKGHIRTTHAMRLGFRQVSGLSEDHALRIESVRGRGFDSVRDLWLRTRLPPSVLERLANADAFGSLGLTRRDALWAVRALQRAGDKDDLPLFRARRHAGARAGRRRCRRCRRASRWSRTIATCICRSRRTRCSFLRRELDRARHHARTSSCRAFATASASPSPGWCWCASGPAPPRA